MNDLNRIWSQTLQLITSTEDSNRPNYEAWLRSAQPIAVHDDMLIVAVPNHFAKTYLEGKLADRLAALIASLFNRKIRLEFVVPESTERASGDDDQAAAATDPATGAARRTSDTAHQSLNPRYQFDSFVVGPGNRLAHAAALAVADAPGKAYNPLFIYGGVGLGKTHLMQAIAHRILARSTRAKVVYVSSETFTNEFITAIREGRQLHFRNRYRYADALLIDDVQFIASKETTQEEFFHTFNTLHEARRQIVISSDRPPKEIPTLEDRLRSRFEWGLISDIQPPDLETRVAILQKKAQLEDLVIPEDVLEYIATRIPTNIRELEGALIRLIAYTSFHGLDITLPVAEEALREILPEEDHKPITISLIQAAVADHYNLDIRDFKMRKRTRAIAFPRQIAMYLARELTGTSLPLIGHEFGGRDHTTVLYACEKIAQEIQTDPDLAAIVHSLKKKLLS